ncbi:hypothetical protein [Streptomyces sp. RTd22]|uniref:hypothetical protein n=1 Tax=Streptomyces sp. RTd22 TaxID=1841249 RepID=UPI0007C4E972|nr:hypothetical protein [Streptomyces sp. RTd22]
MTTSLLARLKSDREAATLACHPFEFDTDFDTITHIEPVWLASGAPLEPIAKDHGGGTYFLCGEGDGEDRPVVHADSEGHSGVMGATLRDALLLKIALPCAGAALYRERQGRTMDEQALEALRAEEEAELSEDYELDVPAMRVELLERLGLAPLPPLTELLERERALEALEPQHALVNEDGNVYRQGLEDD